MTPKIRDMRPAPASQLFCLALSALVATAASAGSATRVDPTHTPPPREPIRLFEDRNLSGAALSEEMSRLAGRQGLLLLQAASFDPVLQGQPDFSRTFPTNPSYMDSVRASNGGRDAIAYIVQFDGSITEEMRDSIKKQGATPLFYIPNNAYLVRMKPTSFMPVRQSPGVRWVGRYLPGYKIHGSLARFALNLDQQDLQQWFLPDGTPKSLYLTLFPGSDLDEVAQRAAGAGFRVLATSDDPEQPVVVVEPPRGPSIAISLADVANIEAVVSIIKHDPMEPRNDDMVWIHQTYNTTSTTNYSVTAKIWNHDLLGEGEIVVLADSGVDRDMCFYRTSSGSGYVATQTVSADGQNAGAITVDNTQRKILAYNVLSSYQGAASALDDDSSHHGSHMAGTILGDNFANLATEDGTVNDASASHNTADGMAPQAKLIVQDIGSTAGLVGVPPIIDTMWQQAYNAGARTSSNSYGGGGNIYGIDAQLVDRMIYKNENFMIMFAAGNGGVVAATAGSMEAQGNQKNGITVGSAATFTASPFGNNRSPESGVGPTGDGRIKPDIMGATGCGAAGGACGGAHLRSALGTSTTGDNNCGTASFLSGTSSATASTSGSAVLAREYYVKGYYPSGKKTPADGFDPSGALVKATMLNSGRNMDGAGVPAAANADAPSSVQGWGRTTLDDALWFNDEDGTISANTRKLVAFDVRHANGLATGDVWETDLDVDGTTQFLKITLAWSDAPAQFDTLVNLVNDLNLEVVAPDGRIYHGNQWYAEDASKSTIEDSLENVTAFDNLNNVEGVYLETDAQGTFPTGKYKIRVIGKSVPGSPVFGEHRQGFALVATGQILRGAGRVAITKRQIGCEGVVNITLFDTNSSAAVTVTTTGGDSETVTMSGVSPNFSGSINAFFNEPIVTSDNRLQVIQNETITATYNDSNPSGYQSTSTSRVLCTPTLQVTSHTFAGGALLTSGCDNDEFLDNGESADLKVTLTNNGPTDLTGVSAKLISRTSGVYVAQPDTISFPNIPAGGSATNSTPFKVSAKGVTPLQTGNLRLEVTADGRLGRPIQIDFATTLEADRKVTNGLFRETFDDDDQDGTPEASDVDGTMSAVKCNNDPSLDTNVDWFWLDIDGTCGVTASPNWGAVTGCDGATNREVMYPVKTGSTCATADGTDNPFGYTLRSHLIFTGNPGSKTTFKNLRIRPRYSFASFDGSCDLALGVVFRLVDPAGFLFTPLTISTSRTKSDAAMEDFDLTESYDFAVADNSDMWAFVLEFDIIMDGATLGTPTCQVAGSGGETSNWRIDDVELVYTNEEIVADATTCPPCGSSPPAPSISASATASNQTAVYWNGTAGADHYDVYRGGTGCTGMTLVGTVRSLSTGFADTPQSTSSIAYQVKAVNASGLCESSFSNCANLTPTGSCIQASGPPQNLLAANSALSSCQMNLTWSAPSSNPCGHTLNYRIYRGTDAGFTPNPGNLLTTVSATSYSDTTLVSGFDSAGEPTGTDYFYVVRALDTVTGVEEQNTSRAEGRAGGPRVNGTWLDDAGDTRLVKMASLVGCDFNDSKPAWTISSLEDSDGTTTDATKHSYRSVKTSLANNRLGTSDPLTCTTLVSPRITLSSSPAPSLRFFRRFNVEEGWDGVVVETSTNNGLSWQILSCPYPGTFHNTVTGGCDTDGDGTGNCPLPPGGSFDCDLDGTGSCDGEGDRYINSCDYAPAQGAYTGPVGNAALTAWVQDTCSLASLAGQTVQFRFNLSTDCGSDFEGFYADRIEVLNAQIESSCAAAACATAPTFPGLASALDLDSVLDTGVKLTWPPVSNWGGGGTGTFEVYRNGSPIQTGISSATTNFTDNGAVNNLLHSYRVVAKGGGSCNVRDGNDVDLSAADCVEPTPADVNAAILTLAKGAANVEIASTAVPNANQYRFHYSTDRTNVFVANTYISSPAPRGVHAALTDGTSWYYLLKVTDGAVCGDTVVP